MESIFYHNGQVDDSVIVAGRTFTDGKGEREGTITARVGSGRNLSYRVRVAGINNGKDFAISAYDVRAVS